MSIASSVRLKGLVEISLHRRRDGKLVHRTVVPNRIVDYGFDLMSRLMVSAFLNDAAENFATVPVQAIAVGIGTSTGDVQISETALETEWQRQRIESVEILTAGFELNDDQGSPALQLTSKVHGAYGNRIEVQVIAASGPYSINITDKNEMTYNGVDFGTPGPVGPVNFQNNDFGLLLADINANSLIVKANAPDSGWAGDLATGQPDNFSGGGGGVVVSATFSNNTGSNVELTEAGLFTSDIASEPLMFNRVKFPIITISNDLDITFRWKLLFQEATP